MNIVYDQAFYNKLKKANVRIRKSVKEKMLLFSKDPNNPQLNNHSLREKYKGCQSIDIEADYRAIYQETKIGEETVAYFITLGTHEELYKNNFEHLPPKAAIISK